MYLGVETIAHLRENGRITVMLTAFQGPPQICRLFGKGKGISDFKPQRKLILKIFYQKARCMSLTLQNTMR